MTHFADFEKRITEQVLHCGLWDELPNFVPDEDIAFAGTAIWIETIDGVEYDARVDINLKADFDCLLIQLDMRKQ